MEEIKNELSKSTKEGNEQNENTATTPENKTEITIPVKYNKETRELDIQTASILAQKGMKYDVISKDYEELKRLATQQNKSVTEFLADLRLSRFNERKNYLTEKCGGDTALAEQLARLEMPAVSEHNGFSELKALFPEIQTKEQLPLEVLENSELKGTLLLDEYLRYRLNEKIKRKNAVAEQKRADNISLGSQQSRQNRGNPETEEFLKGLWRN